MKSLFKKLAPAWLLLSLLAFVPPACTPAEAAVITTGTPTDTEFLFVSPVMNWLTTASNVVLTPTSPWKSGNYFMVSNARFIIDTLDGTITTGATMNVGNDASKINMMASSSSHLLAASVNTAFASGMPALVAAAGVNNLNRQLIDPSVTSIKLDVTVATTTATATVFRGRLFLWGFVMKR